MGEANSKVRKKNKNSNIEENNNNKQEKESSNEINNQENDIEDFVKKKIPDEKNKKIENQNNNNNLNNIIFQGIIGGNKSKIDEEENMKNEIINTEPDAMSEDFRPRNRFRRLLNKENEKEKIPIIKKNNNDMINKLESKKKLNINPSRNNNGIKIDPMMMTADNFHSKKIVFHVKEVKPIEKNEIKENLIHKKEEAQINKENLHFNKFINKFRNINGDENINNKLLNKRNFQQRNIHFNKYKSNFNTNNNEEEEEEPNSLNRRFNKIINKAILTKPKNSNININIDDNINNVNNENKINLNNKVIKEIKQIEPMKKGDKKEDDDLDLNININNLIEENSNRTKSTNIEIESNNKKFEKGNLTERKMIRNNTYSNFNLEVTSPQNIFLFDNYNIFDSFLVILNNNSYINKYLAKNQNKIYNSQKRTQYCLSIILYYINKYLWTRRPESIINKNDLNFKYFEFLNCYLDVNCKNSNREIYLYNTDNLEAIINFIFYKINIEITAEHIGIENFNYNSKDAQLNQFMKNFVKNNKSVISDNFTGFYKEETSCINCKNRMERYGNIYMPYKEYSSFNYIYLDLENINNQYGNQNSGFLRRNASFCGFMGNNFNQNFVTNYNMNTNLYICLNNEFTKSFQSACNICQFSTFKYIQKQFLSLPKILTIIINNKNANFILNSEINLSQFTNAKGNHNYYLIALLCKYAHNKNFITYCFNYKDGNWYSYTKKEGYHRSIKERSFLEPNAIPYLLVYQNIGSMDFEYNELNLEIANNKKEYTFRFQNGMPPATLYFGINATVQEVCKEIERFYKLKKVKLVINAQQMKENEILSLVALNNCNILVIPI